MTDSGLLHFLLFTQRQRDVLTLAMVTSDPKACIVRTMRLQEEDIENILVNEIGKLGAVGGAVGGAIGTAIGGAGAIVGGFAGVIGGAFGAKFSAKRLPTESYQATVQTNQSAEQLANLISRRFDNQQPETLEGGLLVFKMLKSGGFQNPALLIAIINGSAIHLAAYAKEGLIKQHTAKKAVESFTAILKEIIPGAQ